MKLVKLSRRPTKLPCSGIRPIMVWAAPVFLLVLVVMSSLGLLPPWNDRDHTDPPFVTASSTLTHHERKQPTTSSSSSSPNASSFNAFPSFCDSNGTCHETPWLPSPRTVYSAWSQEQLDVWWRCHATLNETAATYARNRRREPSSSSSRPLILWGDSITESWLGTGMGIPKERARGVPDVLTEWSQHQSSSSSSTITWDPLVNALSGDQTQHLLYRMQHGQLLPEYATPEDALHVILIGTNNLGSGELPGPTADGILAVLDYLLLSSSQQQRRPTTASVVLVLHVLPRGDGRTVLPTLCPPRCRRGGRPFRSFLPAIRQVNQALQEGIAERQRRRRYGSRRVHALDCGQRFLLGAVRNDDGNVVTGEEEVDITLMPDRLHPNAAGHRILADCIQRFVDEHDDLFTPET